MYKFIYCERTANYLPGLDWYFKYLKRLEFLLNTLVEWTFDIETTRYWKLHNAKRQGKSLYFTLREFFIFHKYLKFLFRHT